MFRVHKTKIARHGTVHIVYIPQQIYYDPLNKVTFGKICKFILHNEKKMEVVLTDKESEMTRMVRMITKSENRNAYGITIPACIYNLENNEMKEGQYCSIAISLNGLLLERIEK